MIVIAHRLSTAARADLVAVVQGGRLVEVGTHDELVARGGPYAALYASWTGRRHRRLSGVERLRPGPRTSTGDRCTVPLIPRSRMSRWRRLSRNRTRAGQPSVRLANRLIVSIEHHSLQVPTFSNAEPLELGVPEFLLLAELGRADGGRGRRRSTRAVTGAGLDRRAGPGSSGSPPRLEQAAGSRPARARFGARGRSPRTRRCDVPELDADRRDLHATLRAPGTRWVRVRRPPSATGSRPSRGSSCSRSREITEPTRLRDAIVGTATAGAHALGEDEFLATFGRLAELGIVAIGHRRSLPGYLRVRRKGSTTRCSNASACAKRSSPASPTPTTPRSASARSGPASSGPRSSQSRSIPSRRSHSRSSRPTPRSSTAAGSSEHYDFRRDWVWNDDRLEQFTADPRSTCSRTTSGRTSSASPSPSGQGSEPGEHHHPRRPRHAEVRGRRASVLRRAPARRHHRSRRGRAERRRDARRALRRHRRRRTRTSRCWPTSPGIYLPRRRPRRAHRRPRPHRRPRHRSRRRSSPACSTCSPTSPALFVTIETNRGCPYGCTFCDWGSATLEPGPAVRPASACSPRSSGARSRHMQVIGPADANFGMFKRDVEIAEQVAELKETTATRGLRRELREEHREAPAAHHPDAGRRRHHDAGRPVAAVDGRGHARRDPPLEHQDREVRRARRRDAPGRAAADGRAHDRASPARRSSRSPRTCSSASTARCRPGSSTRRCSSTAR